MKSKIIEWRQSLAAMADENILMKTGLSEMLQGNFDINLLPQVENFYLHLLTEDAFINLLRHNIGELDALIKAENPKVFNKTRFESLCSILQSQMITADIRFAKVKSEFNKFYQEKEVPQYNPQT